MYVLVGEGDGMGLSKCSSGEDDRGADDSLGGEHSHGLVRVGSGVEREGEVNSEDVVWKSSHGFIPPSRASCPSVVVQTIMWSEKSTMPSDMA